MTEFETKKKAEVLEAIKPICDAYKIKDYDYLIDENGRERLKLNQQLIYCSGNSIDAIIDELTGYIFVTTFARNRYLGAFRTQTLNVITQYWVKE